MAAVIVGVLVLVAALAGNAVSALIGESLWTQLTRRSSRIAIGGALAAVAVVAAALAGAITDTSAGNDIAARPVSDFMWDASGLRPGIVYRDELTPWADQPLFNAIINQPPGDERRFVRAVVIGRDAEWKTRLEVRPGDRLLVKVLVVNEAEPVLNDSPDRRGIARGTRVSIGYSDTASVSPTVFSVVSADNADPRWVASRVDLWSRSPTRLRFKTGSATLMANGKEISRLPDPALVAAPSDASTVAHAGVLVGATAPDGVLPAGTTNAIEVLATFEVAKP